MHILRTCPSCNGEWDDEAIFCPDDGAPLTEARLDRYRLVRRVARGGMSELFEARHEHIDRRFALKLMRADLGADVEAVERLRREARASSAIGHPNIIDVTDFGQTADGSVYMVMEWIDGETVRQLLDRGPVDAMLALEIAYQAAAGLAAAHSIGVVHRDVKPANLGLTRREDGSVLVKVLDFGIAKLTMGTAPKLTKTGIFLGTPSYSSPEQALGENLDGRSDIYSLGCVMYEMFTGQKVYGPQTSPMELAKLHATALPMAPSQRAPGRQISADIDAIVMCCLAKARDKRFPSMARLRDTLDQLRSGMATLHGEPPGMDMTGAHGRPGDDNKVTLLFQRGMAVEFRQAVDVRQAAPLEPTQIVEPGQGPFAARDVGPPMTIPIELPRSAGMPVAPTVVVSPLPTPLPLDPMAPAGEPAAPVATATPTVAPARRKSRKFLLLAAAVAVIAATIGVVAARGTKRGHQPTAAKTEKSKSGSEKSARKSKSKSASKSKSKSAATAKAKSNTATTKNDASNAKPATGKSEAPVAAKAVETAATGPTPPPGETVATPAPATGAKPGTPADAKPADATASDKTSAVAAAEVKPAAAEVKPAAAEAKPAAAEAKPAVAETKPPAAEAKPAAAEAKPAVAETKPAAAAEAKPVVAGTKPAVAETKPAVAETKPAAAVEKKPAVAAAKPATATAAKAPAPATPAAVTPAVAVAAPSKPAAAGGAWTRDVKAQGFQLKVVATPRQLMPSAPIALQVSLHHASPAIARRLGKGKLIADVHFRHLAQRSARGMVSDKVDTSGSFDAIFSVPEPGRYHLRVALTDGVRPLGQATLSLCVGADPDGPDAAKICPEAAPVPPHGLAARKRPLGVRLDEPVEQGGAPR